MVNLPLDTNKVNAHVALCRLFWGIGQLDSAMVYANKIDSLSRKIVFKKGVATGLNLIGAINLNIGNYEKAERFFLKANDLFKQLDLKKQQANSLNNLGEIYRFTGNYPKAFKMHYSALKIREEIKDSNGIAMSQNNMAVIYEKQANYKSALTNYFLALRYYKYKGIKPDIARTYNNIAEVFRLQKAYEKALDLQILSLQIRKSIDDVVGISMSYHNLGTIKLEMAKKAIQNKNILLGERLYDEALIYFLSAKEIQNKIGDGYVMAVNQIDIGSIYNYKKKFKEAEFYLENAKAISEKIGSKECIRQSTEGLSELYSSMGDFKKAYKFYRLSISYKDSLLNEESTKNIVQAEMQYSFDKKEAAAKAEQKQKDLLSEKNKQNQRMLLYIALIGLVIVVVFSLFLYNRFKLTNRQKKIIELKEQEAQKQNEIISSQKILVEEKHKEITDSINYAERIQKALLASKKMLDENLLDYLILFKPKDIVSGDFYWATRLLNGNFILAIADSTGHGVPGAIMSILNISSLDKAITEGIHRPDLILNETRKLIIESLKNDGSEEGGKDGMDGSLLKFDFKNKVLECACANSPVWIFSDNKLIEIKPDRMPIGKDERDTTPFNLKTISLKKGDVIYSLTDGFPDQFGGPNGKKFKSKTLQELLMKIHKEPMDIQKQILTETFNNWRGGLEQVDDVCVIGVRV
jgi:serine phosphatase RsbU (regulator of sigma subunit)